MSTHSINKLSALPSNRYQSMFARLRDANEGALVPFLMLGDPDLETSFERICAVVDAGADALELGIPYSDPVADGPTIVLSANRALTAGVTPDQALTLIERLRAKYPAIPIGLLVYANLVFVKTVDVFYQRAQAAGVDSILVPDVPLREADVLRRAGANVGIETVFILPPNASIATTHLVAEQSQAYVYLLSRAGVTGSETKAEMPLAHLLSVLAEKKSAPPLLGFGISEPAQVREAVRQGAAGVIVGSALVAKAQAESLDHIRQYIREMKAATR